MIRSSHNDPSKYKCWKLFRATLYQSNGQPVWYFCGSLQLKKDVDDANTYKNKIKESSKKLEENVKELEEQLTKNKSKVKSQKVQMEQLRKAQKAKVIEEEGAKGKTEVKENTRERLFLRVAYDNSRK